MARKDTSALEIPRERRIHLRPVAAAAAVLIALLANAHPTAQTVTAIKDGTVLTMTGEAIRRGVVLVRDGKILDVGRDLQIPPEARVIDAGGKYIMPGLIDAMTYFGVRPSDRNDPAKPITPENRIINAYAPFSDFMGGRGARDRRNEIWSGGITTIYVAPGDKQVIGGQGAVVKTGGRPGQEAVLREPASVDMTLGDAPKKVFAAQKKSPSTRMSVAALIRKALIQAQEYDQAQQRQREKPAEGASGQPPRRDPANEALVRLLRREVPARIEANLPDDIRTAIRLAEEFGFEVVVDGGIGAHEIADELAQRKIPVVLAPVSRTYMTEVEGGHTKELFAMVNERNAALLAGAGVRIALASFGYSTGYTGSAYQGRWLLLEAAMAAGFLLPEEEALRAVTVNAAEILGVADRIGSIAKGKDADLVILGGHPLDPKTWVEQVYIDGVLVFERPRSR
ncbi:MAG: amidohydrolase family protein [Acidobacteria bacterium]|nr:amidohydrolase family protein [Acidobacteriota bacterium]